MSRERRVETWLSDSEYEAVQAGAEREGLSMSALLRRCFEEWLQVDRAIRRNEVAEQRQARRLHELDPVEARRADFGRAWRPDEDLQGGSRS
jgi:hypothetical protein